MNGSRRPEWLHNGDGTYSRTNGGSTNTSPVTYSNQGYRPNSPVIYRGG